MASDKATQVLLKRPGYRQFYQLYLEFQGKLRINLDMTTFLTDISLRKFSALYEMWSVFEVTKLVINELTSQRYGHGEQPLFFEVEEGHFHFQARKNVANIVLSRGDQRVHIVYEPVYPNVAQTPAEKIVTTHGRHLPQTPDMVVELYRNGIPRSTCVFDAKYKRERDPDDASFYPLSEDLEKMANYAANIQYNRYSPEHRGFQTGRLVSSAYVLYPENRVDEEAGGEIGGLPLRLNMSQQQREKVRQKVRDLLVEAKIL